MTALRRGGVQAGAILAVIGLIFGAVALGLRISGRGLLDGLPHPAVSEFSARAIGPLAPISGDYARQLLGDATFRGLTGEPAAGPAGAGPRPGRPGSGPTGGTAGDQTIEASPGLLGAAPREWVLTLNMVADATVQAGGDIVYRMIIRNIGTEDFGGRNFTLQWHTPAGTISRVPLEACEDVPNDEVRDPCASVPLPLPGLGPSVHSSRNSAGLISIEAGGEWVQLWRVTVPPGTLAGTEFTNHAHLTVTGSEATITTGTVTVTVVE